MLPRLQNGDIVIALDEEIAPPTKVYGKLRKTLVNDSYHAMIYCDGQFLHSSRGERQAGVKAFILEKKIDLSQDVGCYYVIRSKKIDPAMIGRVAQRWNPRLPSFSGDEEAKKYLRKVTQPWTTYYHLPTPYREEHERVKDSRSMHALYRAFRAYCRNHYEDLTKQKFTDKHKETTEEIPLTARPLSRNQGVSCSQFVSYSYSVTLIESVFPSGLPEDIMQSIQKIEATKEENKFTKLTEIDDDLFDVFFEAVEKHLTSPATDASEAKQNAQHKEYVFEKLLQPVKGTRLVSMAKNIFDSPDEWEFMGYLCLLKQKEGKFEYGIIDHNLYRAMIKANGNSRPKIQLVEEDIIEVKSKMPKIVG